MVTKIEAMQELAKRGKLPPEMKPLYDEAVKRGLVGGQQAGPIALKGQVQPQEQPNSERSTNIEYRPKAEPGPDVLNRASTLVENTVEGVPIFGPMIQKGVDFLGADVAGRMFGLDPSLMHQGFEALRAKHDKDSPGVALAGNVAGTVGSLLGGGAVPAVAKGLGLTGSLASRLALGVPTNAAVSALDTAERGGSLEDMTNSGLLSGGLAAAFPIAGSVLKAGGKALYGSVAPTVKGMLSSTKQASNVVGKAYEADRGMGNVMSQADEAAAALNGQPLTNVDRGGQVVRSLARTAANVAPEAASSLKAATQNRFYQQSDRATQFIRRITGGATDDLALQQGIKDLGRQVNKPAYKAAYSAPEAAAIWTPEIRQLMTAPEVQAAVHAAEKAGLTDAALNGGKPVVNPFIFKDGEVVGLRKMKDGSTALPSLPFWDIVQRELRTAKEALGPKELTQAGRYDQLRGKLLGVLDTAVPQFGVARKGAAAFFGAEDALEAGRQFARAPKSLPEATAAHAKFSPTDQKAFSVGWASEQIDAIKAAKDRTNVIEAVFGTPAKREMAELALGTHRAKELEAFVRVERIMDLVKDAISGGSTTASQLAAMGVIGGTSALAGFGTGNLQNGVNVALVLTAGRAGMRYLGKTVDQKVMQKVAEMLASGDKKAMDHAIANAALSKAHMDALEAIMKGLSVTGRGAAMGSLPMAANQ